MKSLVRSALATFVGSLVACSSSSGKTGAVTGTVDGQTLNVASAIAVSAPHITGTCTSGSPNADAGETCTPGPDEGENLQIALTSRSGLTCDVVENDLVANATLLVLTVINTTSNVAPETYQLLGGESGAGAGFATTTATCTFSAQEIATGGTLTLTQVNSTSVVGTFTATFSSHGTLTGSFTASVCNLPMGPDPDAGAPNCVQ